MSKARKGVIPIILFAIFIVTVFASTRSNLRDYNTFYTSDNDFSTTVIDYADGASFVKTDGDVPDHAVSIGDSKGLQEFLLGSGTYGYLIADISIDWEGVGSTITFGSGRVLDGRGHKINLTDKDADALISDEDYGVANLNWSGVAQDCNYSLFICVNSGVIKNTVFEYDTEICAVNNGNAEINGVGIVCGENKGSIENCELNATGKFSYFYMEGTDDYSESFQNYFGGFAGKNNGRIVNVKGNFNDFDLRLRTIANSDDMFGEVELISKTVAGGIAGCMTDPDGECRNVVILGNNVVFNLTSDCFGDVSGIKYSGAVVADNTCGGTVDNVIVNFSPEYVESLSNRDFVSKNAVVHCGAVTNVTAIDTYEGGKNIRSVNCDCDSHKYSYCNAIYLDELTNVEYGINDNGEQVFEITSEKGYIESLSFNKYRIVNGGFTTDDSFYGDDLDNFDSHNFDIRWDKG
ncbi:MAG: hypothetical protein K2N32_03135, partial [Clostridia bacterium]|nr:hypothetical protein [Clostridia bacterium]